MTTLYLGGAASRLFFPPLAPFSLASLAFSSNLSTNSPGFNSNGAKGTYIIITMKHMSMSSFPFSVRNIFTDFFEPRNTSDHNEHNQNSTRISKEIVLLLAFTQFIEDWFEESPSTARPSIGWRRQLVP